MGRGGALVAAMAPLFDVEVMALVLDVGAAIGLDEVPDFWGTPLFKGAERSVLGFAATAVLVVAGPVSAGLLTFLDVFVCDIVPELVTRDDERVDIDRCVTGALRLDGPT